MGNQTTGAAASQRELARRLGVAAKQITKYVHDPRWKFGKGPWDAAAVEQIRAWRKATLSANPGAVAGATPPKGVTAHKGPAADAPADAADATADDQDLSPDQRANLALKTERTRYLRLQREIEEGKYLLRAEVEAERVRRVHAVKAALQQLQRLAPKLVGMGEPEIATVIDGEVTKILHGFARDDAGSGDGGNAAP